MKDTRFYKKKKSQNCSKSISAWNESSSSCELNSSESFLYQETQEHFLIKIGRTIPLIFEKIPFLSRTLTIKSTFYLTKVMSQYSFDPVPTGHPVYSLNFLQLLHFLKYCELHRLVTMLTNCFWGSKNSNLRNKILFEYIKNITHLNNVK